MPVISSLPEGENKYKILMKSPWEILQSPAGSGGIISLFSKHSIMDNLINMGVEYIEVRFLFPKLMYLVSTGLHTHLYFWKWKRLQHFFALLACIFLDSFVLYIHSCRYAAQVKELRVATRYFLGWSSHGEPILGYKFHIL